MKKIIVKIREYTAIYLHKLTYWIYPSKDRDFAEMMLERDEKIKFY